MIFIEKVDGIIDWIEENRPDKDSGVPYVMPNEVEGGYELPEDDLIEQGLKELGIDYTLIVVVGGWSFSVPSADIVKSESLD